MVGRRIYWLLFFGILAIPFARAQQTTSQPSPELSNTSATIKCHGQSYVTLTADAEQAMPLQVVTTANCNEQVSILSDPQGYTLKVRTAAGRVGYVARFEVAIEEVPAGKSLATTQAQLGAEGQTSSESRADAQQGASSKPRIYVSDTESWTASGGFGNPSSVAPGNLYGGYNPDLVDVYQDFTSDCPGAMVTQQKSNVDYVVLFDKQSNKKGITSLGGLMKVNKVTVLSKSGNTLLSQTSHSVDTAVKMACDAINQRSGASTTQTSAVAP